MPHDPHLAERMRGALAGRVPVEAQRWFGREPPQFVQLRLGQRSAERRHRAAEAGAVQRDHVHIAFGNDDPASAGIAVAAEIGPRQRPVV